MRLYSNSIRFSKTVFENRPTEQIGLKCTEPTTQNSNVHQSTMRYLSSYRGRWCRHQPTPDPRDSDTRNSSRPRCHRCRNVDKDNWRRKRFQRHRHLNHSLIQVLATPIIIIIINCYHHLVGDHRQPTRFRQTSVTQSLKDSIFINLELSRHSSISYMMRYGSCMSHVPFLTTQLTIIISSLNIIYYYD